MVDKVSDKDFPEHAPGTGSSSRWVVAVVAALPGVQEAQGCGADF
jgi:hypothetical protein